jgi:hypothetical protein
MGLNFEGEVELHQFYLMVPLYPVNLKSINIYNYCTMLKLDYLNTNFIIFRISKSFEKVF